jgi:branched-chain amino acid transport system ATP-binding protein
MSEPTLRLDQLSVAYGAVRALQDVDLEIGRGALVGLIGPNGAGKTTLIDAVTGFTPANGTVRLEGEDVARWAPHRRAAAGLSRTWQGAELFDDLTVRENLMVATGRPKLSRLVKEGLSGRPVPNRAVDDALQLMRISHLAEIPADSLTEGQRKLVGVARAIASEPKVVCLDEPGAGLDRQESAELARHLQEIAARGVALLLVDHDMELVFAACTHVVVLDFGQVIARGTPDSVRADPAVMKAYLGGGPSLDAPIEPQERTPTTSGL